MSKDMSSVQKYSDWYDNIRVVSLKNPLIASTQKTKLQQYSYQNKEYFKATSPTSARNVNEGLFSTDDVCSSSSDTSSITGRKI